MKTLESLVNSLVFFLQLLLIGLILAFLRHRFRWLYYPVKWLTTFVLSLMVSVVGLVVFKLLFGINSEWFHQLLYDIGNSTDMASAGFWFTIWLILVGSFLTTLIDNAVFFIEKRVMCEDLITRDEKGRLQRQIDTPWDPTTTQSFLWNIYGLAAFILVLFKLLTHDGSSLFGVWE